MRRALAVAPRGFVRRDNLVLETFAVRLKLEWRAREVHPWDRHLAPERRRALFRQQAMEDADAAIARCFRLLSELDEIEVRVLAPRADTLVLVGTVARRDALSVRAVASPRMRLELMGVRAAPE